jgi:hypothetical protein
MLLEDDGAGDERGDRDHPVAWLHVPEEVHIVLPFGSVYY